MSSLIGLSDFYHSRKIWERPRRILDWIVKIEYKALLLFKNCLLKSNPGLKWCSFSFHFKVIETTKPVLGIRGNIVPRQR